MKKLLGVVVLLSLVPWALAEESSNRLSPVTALQSLDTAAQVDVGWYYDEIDARFTPSLNSNYLLDAMWPGGWMGVTDQFIWGDTFQISVDGGPWQFTAFDGPQPSLFPIGDPTGDAGWTADYAHGYFWIDAGAHSIELQGDGVGGLPAGLYVRFDTIPEPASLLLLGLGGLLLRRR